MVGRHGETAVGTIVDTRIDITRPSSTPSASCADREFVVDVTTLDGDRFRTKVIQPRLFGDWRTPRIGASTPSTRPSPPRRRHPVGHRPPPGCRRSSSGASRAPA